MAGRGSGGSSHFASADLQAPDRSRDARFGNVFAAFAGYRYIQAYPNRLMQIYLMDVGMNTDGAGAHGNLASGDCGLWTLAAQNRPVADDWINLGPGGLGYICWTDGKAKCGFMDGHVQTLKMPEVKKENLNPALQ